MAAIRPLFAEIGGGCRFCRFGAQLVTSLALPTARARQAKAAPPRLSRRIRDGSRPSRAQNDGATESFPKSPRWAGCAQRSRSYGRVNSLSEESGLPTALLDFVVFFKQGLSGLPTTFAPVRKSRAPHKLLDFVVFSRPCSRNVAGSPQRGWTLVKKK